MCVGEHGKGVKFSGSAQEWMGEGGLQVHANTEKQRAAGLPEGYFKNWFKQATMLPGISHPAKLLDLDVHKTANSFWLQ